VADAASARLLHPGDRIDVLAAPPAAASAAPFDGPGADEAADPGLRSAERARPLVSAVPVIAIPGEGDAKDGIGFGGPSSGADEGSYGDGALIVVAARHDQAATLASPADGPRLSFVIVG